MRYYKLYSYIIIIICIRTYDIDFQIEIRFKPMLKRFNIYIYIAFDIV